MANSKYINMFLGIVLLATIFILFSKLHKKVNVIPMVNRTEEDNSPLRTISDTNCIEDPFIQRIPVKENQPYKISKRVITSIAILEANNPSPIDNQNTLGKIEGYLAFRNCSLFYFADRGAWSDSIQNTNKEFIYLK